MELKTWNLTMRLLNCSSAAMLLGFQIWFMVDLCNNRNIWGIILRIWAPLFIMYINSNVECSQDSLYLFNSESRE